MSSVTERAQSTLTRAKLAKAVAQQLGLSQIEGEYFLEELLAQLMQALARGEKVKISGFGNLNLLDKEARPGRNPKTLDPCEVSARRVVTFKAGNKLKSMIQERIDQESEQEDNE